MSRRLAIPVPHRRGFLAGAAGLFGVSSLAGCDRFAGTDVGRRTLKTGEDANLYVQRLLLTSASLAREFPDSEISPWFKPNGTIEPSDKAYKALAAKNFEPYRLRVDGLVETPLALSLADLRAMPARTQVTRHDCVEGWSAIGKWTGVPLAEILKKAGLKPQARYVVLRCADTMEFDTSAPDEESEAENASDKGGAVAWGGPASDEGKKENTQKDEQTVSDPQAKGGSRTAPSDAKAVAHEKPTDAKATDNPADAPDDTGQGRPIRYYESIDLTDAYHPQTILAYDLNGKALPVSNGAPLRLRVERQLGYKHAKYVMQLVVADSLAGFGQGNGGYWEDNGYEWYAGI